jgi:hypothetical protein
MDKHPSNTQQECLCSKFVAAALDSSGSAPAGDGTDRACYAGQTGAFKLATHQRNREAIDLAKMLDVEGPLSTQCAPVHRWKRHIELDELAGLHLV